MENIKINYSLNGKEALDKALLKTIKEYSFKESDHLALGANAEETIDLFLKLNMSNISDAIEQNLRDALKNEIYLSMCQNFSQQNGLDESAVFPK